MIRAVRLAAIPGLLMLGGAVLGSSGLAATTGSPFYLVPSPTKECRNVKHCSGVVGPWVEVPAGGEATYVFGCPDRRGSIIGGTDARASSSAVRVWFDGRLGAPIGAPPVGTGAGAVLLFHATANTGGRGWFQPVLGCVPLRQKTKRSTVSALPGTAAAAALDLRSEAVLLTLTRGINQTTTLGCPKNEQLVGSWHAFALSSRAPPGPAYAGAVAVTTVAAGNRIRAAFKIEKPSLFGPLAPRSWVQIGAMCEP